MPEEQKIFGACGALEQRNDCAKGEADGRTSNDCHEEPLEIEEEKQSELHLVDDAEVFSVILFPVIAEATCDIPSTQQSLCVPISSSLALLARRVFLARD
jgi:hypothetical protein